VTLEAPADKSGSKNDVQAIGKHDHLPPALHPSWALLGIATADMEEPQGDGEQAGRMASSSSPGRTSRGWTVIET